MLSVVTIVLSLIICGVSSEVISIAGNDEGGSQFEENLNEDPTDPELCSKQINYMLANDTLLMMTFLDSGPRIPKGIMQGNLMDLGTYHQCIDINKEVDDMVIQGKYCQIRTVLKQLNEFGISNVEDLQGAVNNIKDEVNLYDNINRHVKSLDQQENKRIIRDVARRRNNISVSISICIPKSCSVAQALSELRKTQVVNVETQFCRFKNDKPVTPGVYVAIAIFSLLAIVTIISTSYDILNTVIRKKDPKSINKLYQSFSVYTNTRQLLTFTSGRGALECVDGIRALAMAWIVLIHTVATLPPLLNSVDYITYIISLKSFWITAGQYSVDTFFVLSGLLLVYTNVGKINHMKLLKGLHLFYLNRLLRMFPLLALTILLQVGVLNYIHDGPMWTGVTEQTDACREKWWATLLYVQKYFTPMCVSHTWYLAVDMHLHILSPLILCWVLTGKKVLAWTSLTLALFISLTASTIYIFLNNFAGTSYRPSLSQGENERYMKYLYINTLTRCQPFFVGMLFGYFIHYWRERKMRISKINNTVMWIVALAVLCFACYAAEPLKQPDWDNQTIENLVNSFARFLFALGLCWMILVCSEGYGGPINWFLSLPIWKLPSRISYAMYLLHYPIQIVLSGGATQHFYFSAFNVLYTFASIFVIVFILSFVATVLVDSPFSIIFKMLLGGGIKKSPRNPDDNNNKKQQTSASERQTQ